MHRATHRQFAYARANTAQRTVGRLSVYGYVFHARRARKASRQGACAAFAVLADDGTILISHATQRFLEAHEIDEAASKLESPD